eukprot:7758397-Alexandrium_andersonii.AAC.1
MAVHMAKPSHWTRHVVEQHDSMIEDETKGVNSEWVYRSELEKTFGVDTATRWIKNNKFEKDKDSDDESIFKLKRKVHNASTTQRKEYPECESRASNEK